jgi:hypothetical protein
MGHDIVGVPDRAGSEATADQLAGSAYRRPVIDDHGGVGGVITHGVLLLHCTSIPEPMPTPSAVRGDVRSARQGIGEHRRLDDGRPANRR